MLILTRRANEAIVISDDKTGETLADIRILNVVGGQVRLGIDAPANIIVDREEIYLRKQQEYFKEVDDVQENKE